jgi:hypothetical protein
VLAAETRRARRRVWRDPLTAEYRLVPARFAKETIAALAELAP